MITQQYRNLRVGASAVILATVGLCLWLSWRSWPIVRQILWPAELGCGCGVVAITIPPITTFTASLVIIASAIFIGRFIWFLARHMKRSQDMIHHWTVAGQRSVYQQTIGEDIIIVTRTGRQAMTMGLIQPRIYITTDLAQSLNSSELTAVLRHEQAHRQRYDQLWSAVLDSFSAAWWRLPPLQRMVAANLTLRELAADAAATSDYQHISGLSGAIVKLSTVEFSTDMVGFSPNQDRVEKLLNTNWQPRLQLWRGSDALVLCLLVLGMSLIIRLTPPATASVSTSAVRACHETRLLCQRVQEVPYGLWLLRSGPQSVYVFPVNPTD